MRVEWDRLLLLRGTLWRARSVGSRSAAVSVPVGTDVAGKMGFVEPELTLAVALNSSPGCYAILLGAGVSIAADVPSAWGVQQAMIAKLAAGRGA